MDEASIVGQTFTSKNHPHLQDETDEDSRVAERPRFAPKTKGHIKAVIHRLFEKAMLWELVEWQRNPMRLVEIKGISKRRKPPLILTVEQFFLGFELVPQPYRTMVMVATCSGVRAEEVLAIEKPDIHFEKLSLQLFRAIVHVQVKFVKTEYSKSKSRDPIFSLQAPSRDGTTMHRQSNRTTFVLHGAASWNVLRAGRMPASGVTQTYRCRTESACLSTTSAGRRLAHVPPHIPFMAR